MAFLSDYVLLFVMSAAMALYLLLTCENLVTRFKAGRMPVKVLTIFAGLGLAMFTLGLGQSFGIILGHFLSGDLVTQWSF